ncbi:MAG: ABC transporter substrate-binding protein [Halobacteriales archaeon]|nr:ABC transporter substrate-binding protein [Halobacteriales archaeon]
MTDRGHPSRRRFLAGVGTAGLAGLAGCSGLLGSGPAEGTPTADAEPGLIGSARTGRGLPGGTPMAEMPELSGELMVYSGRGEFLVGQLLDFIRERNPELDLRVRYGGAADLANQIRTEGQSTPADVFFTVNAGILGLLAGEDRLVPLPDDVLDLGREGYQHPDGVWIGTSGRVRSLPFNTDALSASDLPTDILDFPAQSQLEGELGWAVTYGSFQGFVTVMRILNGEQRTKEWLQGMVELDIQEYSSEFRVAQAIADGEISTGFTNHYYPVRVLDARPDAPLDIAFTQNDAGSFFNVAGAGVVDASERRTLASNFVRHLLSAEAQDYFARSATFEYPMIPEVDPIERLPSFDELNPPDLDLAEFARADINDTIDLMEEVGVL